MVTKDSKLLLHHFNWQRLSDSKAIVIGLEDDTILLHDVEDDFGSMSTYKDRISHFFPPAPRFPLI
ncbi:hypothetical protein PanWU01x14_204670 [Parasponia andersonii]|uniref:Uncharacterized protein n=1 Tax=Parasponia andersonii TaxID=3476 RepID=A0A2P5BWB3_PARAD|nr:hypothetical protein PanWU01x14_204670 [Parasponia andersonii]